MSLRVQQLNGDTTFLLTFYPPFAPRTLSHRFPGDFTILVDPWLRGSACFLHPSFSTSYHTSSVALHSLQDLGQSPDIILISQDRPDHCHKETLCSFPKTSDTSILATPTAAKKILSWHHFDERQVHVLEPYSPFNDDTLVRIAIPGYTSNGTDGEITITNLPTKRDIAGVHNAIAITYQPASSVLTVQKPPREHVNASTSTLSERGIYSSAATSTAQRSRATSSATQPPPLDSFRSSNAGSQPCSASSHTNSAIASTTTSQLTNHEKVLSVIYTPHGVTPAVLEPYIQHHLTEIDALPLSALLTCLNTEENPWFLGGCIALGAPGGVEIAKRIAVNNWIAAHDEEKVNKGLATAMIKSKSYSVGEVEDLLHTAGVEGTKMHQLDIGEVIRIPELANAVERGDRTRKDVGKGLSMSKGQRMNIENNVLAMPEPMRPSSAPGSMAAAAAAASAAAVAPGTRIRIRREIIHPDGMWI